ncbi:MAG TPA: hypothetical protein P5533_03140 [Candidatus Cloacimonadota bacterium]|nr:hypothetical protein [Candidatus Cloacimonadota bacterium]
MKVELKYNQKYYSGRLDDLIYYFHPGLGKMLARKRPLRMPGSAAKERFGAVSRNLKDLIQNPDYKTDLKIYSELLKEAELISRGASWYQLFTKLMWKMQELLPELDLASLSRQDILDQSLPCRSVKHAVESGLVAMVEGYQRLNNLI